VRIIVVLDSCMDGTAAIVNQHAGIEATRCSAACVGSARALGVRHLLDSCATPRSQIWLANTDADSRVPVNWISSMLGHAERGTHLVLGTVTPDDDLDVHRRHAWLARHHARNGHSNIHGANFGIRADIYQDLGGWPVLVCARRRHAGTSRHRSRALANRPHRSDPRHDQLYASPDARPKASQATSAHSWQTPPPADGR